MGIKVCKFGGTSVADAAQQRKVRAIVESDGDRRYVIPSAPGMRSADDQKVTDLLYLCHEHARQHLSFDEVFSVIERRYLEIVRDLGVGLALEGDLARVKSDIAGGAGPDYAASRGEYLNGKIVAELLGFEFVDAARIVRFDDQGRFDPERTHELVSKTLAASRSAVVPGFYGAADDGRILTFSRGGSDVTGAIVARGVGAEVYENWTDVSGLLMADPRIVDHPRQIEKLTYRELRELAYMGATVLHDEAIFPVREAGIPVNLRNTNEPDHPGTTIMGQVDESPDAPRVTGIAGRRDFTIIAIEKTLMNSEVGFARRLLSVFESHGVSFEHLPSGIDTMSVVIESAALESKLDDVLAEIRLKCRPDSIDVYPDIALVATVGRGMLHTPGMAGRLFGALAEAGVNVRMIDQGSSELNIIVGVESQDFERAVRAIYAAFVR